MNYCLLLSTSAVIRFSHILLVFALFCLKDVSATDNTKETVGSIWISSNPLRTVGDSIPPRVLHADAVTYQEFNETTQKNQTVIITSGGTESIDELVFVTVTPSFNDVNKYYVDEQRWEILANQTASGKTWGQDGLPSYRQHHATFYIPPTSEVFPNTILFFGGKTNIYINHN
jgi:hypothetical protein